MDSYDSQGNIDPRDAISDPTTRRLVEIVEQRFTGTSNDDSVTAVIRGDLQVDSISVRDDITAGAAGAAIVEALNDGFVTARETIRREMASVPGLSPQLVRWLEGDDSPPGNADDLRPEQVMREFRGNVGDATVSFHAPEQRFTSVYAPSTDAEGLAAVVKAANRAFAAAQTGHEGTVPLDEQMGGRLAELDAAMERIEGRLDGVSAELDGLLAQFE